jgi:hypothetical protein
MFGFFALSIGGDCTLSFWRPQGFNGQIEGWTYNHVGRGKGFSLTDTNHDGKEISILPYSLIIPCTVDAFERVQSFMDIQKTMANQHGEARAPYYFTIPMTKEHMFQKSPLARHFGGDDTAYKDAIDHNDRHKFSRLRQYIDPYGYDNILHRVFTNVARFTPWGRAAFNDIEDFESDIPDDHFEHARYNCWTASKSIIQYIAEIDLGEIDPKLPYFYRAKHAENWAIKLGRPTLFGNTTKIDDRMVGFNLGQNHPAFFTRRAINFGDFLQQPVPVLDAEGKAQTILQYMQAAHESGALLSPTTTSAHLHTTGQSSAPRLLP